MRPGKSGSHLAVGPLDSSEIRNRPIGHPDCHEHQRSRGYRTTHEESHWVLGSKDRPRNPDHCGQQENPRQKHVPPLLSQQPVPGPGCRHRVCLQLRRGRVLADINLVVPAVCDKPPAQVRVQRLPFHFGLHELIRKGHQPVADPLWLFSLKTGAAPPELRQVPALRRLILQPGLHRADVPAVVRNQHPLFIFHPHPSRSPSSTHSFRRLSSCR